MMLPRFLLPVALGLCASSLAAQGLPAGDWANFDGCGHRDPASGYSEGMLLNAKGIRGAESICEFLEVWPASDRRWAVLMLCSGEGMTWTRLTALILTDDSDLILANEGEEDITLRRCPD